MKHLNEILHEFVELFERLQVDYAVIGGLAARAHGIPRPTYDVDFTIAASEEKLKEIYQAAEELGYTLPEHHLGGWRDQVADMSLLKFHLFFDDRKIDIDVFLAQSPFLQEALKRHCREHINGLSLWMVTPEDLILLKLLASRPRDLVDIADVLFTQGQLDETYLRSWADRLHIRNDLENALNKNR